MATIKEIAELAGVSRGTVDRVLNHRGLVNPNTEKKVLEIAELLNYQPNKAGIALAAQKKKYVIGVLLFGKDNPFFDEVIEGLHKKTEELSIYGCTILEKRIPFDPLTQLEAIEEFVRSGIHGLILSPYNDERIHQKIDALWEAGIPCITVNTDMPDSKRIAYVGSDYYKCGQAAAGLLRLMSSGRTKVGIITGSHNVLCHEDRIKGFSEAVSVNHDEIEIVEILENDDDDYKSYEVVSALLSRHPALDAIYFTAAGVYGGCRAIRNANLSRIPKVITFDAVPSTVEMLKEGVIAATICQQPEEQGAFSLALLVDYLVSGKMPEQTLLHMDLEIKIKESF